MIRHELLKRLRKDRGHLLRDAAKLAEINVSHLSNVERGIKTPGLDVLDRIAKAYGMELRVSFIERGVDCGITYRLF